MNYFLYVWSSFEKSFILKEKNEGRDYMVGFGVLLGSDPDPFFSPMVGSSQFRPVSKTIDFLIVIIRGSDSGHS